MKKLFSARYSAGAINAGMLILRLAVGILMLNAGYSKLVHFSELQSNFINFMGLGKTISLALCVFAEFFCSMFLLLGMFTRLACIPLIINMVVIIFIANEKDYLGKAQLAELFLTGYIVLLICGPGKISVDSAIGK